MGEPQLLFFICRMLVRELYKAGVVLLGGYRNSGSRGVLYWDGGFGVVMDYHSWFCFLTVGYPNWGGFYS